MFELKNTKYHVQYTSRFKKEFKKVLKQGKNENDFLVVLKL
jgi:mRNA-degrading endonuclease YafQ of YafQ-DinJ toxin-antitoxin module